MGDVKFKEGDRVVIARGPTPLGSEQGTDIPEDLRRSEGEVVVVDPKDSTVFVLLSDQREWWINSADLDHAPIKDRAAHARAEEVEIPVPGAPVGWYTKGSTLVVKAAELEPEETVWPRATVLREAERLCCGDRNATYGSPSQDFQRIATMWSVLFSREFKPHEVAMALACLKLSRLVHSPQKMDSWTDLAGYAACGAEVAGETE